MVDAETLLAIINSEMSNVALGVPNKRVFGSSLVVTKLKSTDDLTVIPDDEIARWRTKPAAHAFRGCFGVLEFD